MHSIPGLFACPPSPLLFRCVSCDAHLTCIEPVRRARMLTPPQHASVSQLWPLSNGAMSITQQGARSPRTSSPGVSADGGLGASENYRSPLTLLALCLRSLLSSLFCCSLLPPISLTFLVSCARHLAHSTSHRPFSGRPRPPTVRHTNAYPPAWRASRSVAC